MITLPRPLSDIESTMNDYGFTMGSKAGELQRLMKCLSECYTHDLLTDWQFARAFHKLMKKVRHSTKIDR